MTTDEELRELFVRMGKYPINQETGELMIKIITTYYATHKINYTTLEDDWKKTIELFSEIINDVSDFDVSIAELPQQMKDFYSECFTAFLGIIEGKKK